MSYSVPSLKGSRRDRSARRAERGATALLAPFAIHPRILLPSASIVAPVGQLGVEESSAVLGKVLRCPNALEELGEVLLPAPRCASRIAAVLAHKPGELFDQLLPCAPNAAPPPARKAGVKQATTLVGENDVAGLASFCLPNALEEQCKRPLSRIVAVLGREPSELSTEFRDCRDALLKATAATRRSALRLAHAVHIPGRDAL